MPTKVETSNVFKKSIKRLSRKYPKLLNELELLIGDLKEGLREGVKIPNIGYDVYKVRLKNPDSQRGESGGFRLIYYIRLADNVILLTIYSKSDQTDIANSAILDIIQEHLKLSTDDDDED